MTITFIGHGYVGLVTACVFADFGNKVWVVGHTEEKIKRLKSGDPIIFEPGLKELLQKNLKAKRIFFTTSYEKPATESEIIFIAVGTPPKANGEADLSTVFEVAQKIAKHIARPFTVVSCKSTVPVGTNKQVEQILNKNKRKGIQIAVASCPEFLREGTGIQDTLNPDRIIIGSDSQKAIQALINLHKPLPGKRVVTNLASAELIKYTSNAMLATKISFANLISFYCEKTGADVETVLEGVGLDKRIGRVFLNPGVGYGGSCFPKDVKALIKIGENLDLDTLLLDAVEKINRQAKDNFIEKIQKHCKGKTVTIWGISFKPDTDDIREAPSLYTVNKLLEMGYSLKVYDPVALSNAKKILGNKVSYYQSPYEAALNTDAIAILTEWNEFRQIDLDKVKKSMKKPIIIDGRNIYPPSYLKKLGFTYIPTGRI